MKIGKKISIGDFVLFFVISMAISVFFIISASSFSEIVSISFLIILLTLIFFLGMITFRENIGLFTEVIFVHSLTFFFIAPVLQTHYGFYPNTMLANDELIVRTNLLLLIFLISFLLGRWVNISKRKVIEQSDKILQFSMPTFYFFFFFLIVLIYIYRDDLLFAALNPAIRELTAIQESISQPIYLVQKNFLFSISLFVAYFLLTDGKKYFRNRFFYIITVISSFAFLFLFKNPLREKRYALGPIYLTLLILIFPKLIKNKRTSLILLIIIITLLFPISQAVTHSKSKSLLDIPTLLANRIENFDLTEAFRSLDYDSWSMGMAIVEYVNLRGITYGRQLLGVLLFFIPRGIWPSKPVGSGYLVAKELLMTKYFMWFSNLSCPLFGEAYINFGIVGVIIFGIILGIIAKRFDFRLGSKKEFSYRDALKIYISLYMFYLLRGDLMSSFAYLTGNLLAMIIFPSVVNNFWYKILKVETKKYVTFSGCEKRYENSTDQQCLR